MGDENESRIAGLEKEIWALKAEQAESRPVGEVVKYLLYFWLTLSVVLGIFGWTQVSDIDSKIDAAVLRQFPEDSRYFKDYVTLIKQTKGLYEDFERLTQEYKARVADLRYADLVAEDFDIEGQVIKMVIESDIPGRVLDERWRVRAISTLTRLKEAIADRAFPADFVFNAAQVARQLHQFQLAEEMTLAAYQRDASPPIRALKLSSEASNSTGEKQSEAFEELIRMVRELDYQDSPHIVLGEAWNASENVKNYIPLLNALDTLLSSEGDKPSYAFAMKAQVLLRLSRAGDLERAAETLAQGYAKFTAESSQSQWNDSFVREYSKLKASIDEERIIVDTPLGHPVGFSDQETGDLDSPAGLRQFLQALESLQEPAVGHIAEPPTAAGASEHR